jgi:hypothetical protein
LAGLDHSAIRVVADAGRDAFGESNQDIQQGIVGWYRKNRLALSMCTAPALAIND